MNPPVVTQFALPDPNASPLNLTQLVQLLNVLVSSEIRGAYIPYVTGKDQPGANDQDKTWLQLDDSGRPLALKVFYHGHWRRVYNGMIGEIRIYSGNPTVDFDGNGLGKVGEAYDGWHLCNGKPGIPDLSDRFIIGAHMNNNDIPGWDGSQWITTEVKEAGEHQGGSREISLTDKNTFQPKVDIGTLKVGKYVITPGGGETLDPSGPLYGNPSASDETKNKTLNVQSEGNTEPDAINIIPPFLAFAYIIFVGYP